MKKSTVLAAMLALLLFTTGAMAQDQDDIIRTRENSALFKDLSIQMFDWMMGNWFGEALGGEVYEYWGPPADGVMPGMFRLETEDGVGFYEFFLLGEQDGVFMLRLKHFSAELHGWEESDQTVDFKLLDRDATRFYFEGLTIERTGEDEMTVYVEIGTEEGTSIVTFKYYRLN